MDNYSSFLKHFSDYTFKKKLKHLILHVTNHCNFRCSHCFVDFETPIVTYCSGGDCTLSLDLGDFLFYKLGYENVFIFEGGYPHWIEKNLPIKRFCREKPTNNSIDSECIYENE